jgi:hypothetical protein
MLRHLGTVAALLLLLLGAGAVGYSRWSRPIAEGDAALAAGELDAAIASYEAAEARFNKIPSTRAVRGLPAHGVNHLFALYRLGRFDATIEQAERSPDNACHFWAGCVLRKAKAEEETDAALGWLTRRGRTKLAVRPRRTTGTRSKTSS